MGTSRENDLNTINLIELFYVLKQRIWIIILACILGAITFGLFTSMVMKPVFTSSTMLYVVNKTTTLPSLSDLQLGTQLTKDYKVLVTSRPVTMKVIKDLGLNMTHQQLVEKIKVINPTDTRILTISVEDADPYMAKSIADKVAEVASDRMAEIMDSAPPNIVEEAYLPLEKTRPSVPKSVVLGGLAGCFLAGLIILMLFYLNDTIKTPEDVEKYLGLNTLSAIPVFEDNGSSRKKRRKKSFEKGGRIS